MAMTNDTASGPVPAQTITIDRATNGFIVTHNGPVGVATRPHVFEDYRGMFDYLNHEFGQEIPYDRGNATPSGFAKAMEKAIR